MYSPRAGMPDGGWSVDHPDGLLLDIARDDYVGTPAATDLARSSLLAPLAPDAVRPVGW